MILRKLGFLAFCAVPGCTALETRPNAPAVAEAAAPVQIMVLGSFHMDNPGADIVNAMVEDVLTERRQAELQILTQRLAAFERRLTEETTSSRLKFEGRPGPMTCGHRRLSWIRAEARDPSAKTNSGPSIKRRVDQANRFINQLRDGHAPDKL
jgi:hypothetical protein